MELSRSESEKEQHLKQHKQCYGFAVGMTAGLAFASTAWGYDGYLLQQAHAYFPWMKFIIGGLLSMLAGGLAGWLSMRFEKALLGLVFWLAAGGLLAWFTVLVPFVLTPALTGLLAPQVRPLLAYEMYPEMSARIGATYAWIVIAAIITSALQIPLIEQAAFSFRPFGKIIPFLACSFFMLVIGLTTDDFSNQSARAAIIGLDRTIQFSLDHRGEEIDKNISREMHLAALRTVQDSVSETRRLLMTSYDPLIENIQVAVDFNGQWVNCLTMVGSPLNCTVITP
jgi:hypothetical protein